MAETITVHLADGRELVLTETDESTEKAWCWRYEGLIDGQCFAFGIQCDGELLLAKPMEVVRTITRQKATDFFSRYEKWQDGLYHHPYEEEN